MRNRKVYDFICPEVCIFAIHKPCETAALYACFRLVGHTPAAVSVSVFAHHFSAGAFMLSSQSFQAAVFHQIFKILKLVEIAGYAVIVANTAQLRVVR